MVAANIIVRAKAARTARRTELEMAKRNHEEAVETLRACERRAVDAPPDVGVSIVEDARTQEQRAITRREIATRALENAENGVAALVREEDRQALASAIANASEEHAVTALRPSLDRLAALEQEIQVIVSAIDSELDAQNSSRDEAEVIAHRLGVTCVAHRKMTRDDALALAGTLIATARRPDISAWLSRFTPEWTSPNRAAFDRAVALLGIELPNHAA